MQSTYTHKAESDILTVTQAANELGVHADTLRRWANANKVPYFRTPTGHRRFFQTDIDAIKKDPALAVPEAGGDSGPSPKRLVSPPPV